MPVVRIPPASPYADQYTSFAVAVGGSGAEGCKTAPFALQWSRLTAGTFGYQLDFGGRPNMPAQIATLFVDNSRCRLGVYFVFTDTGFRLVVPPFHRGYYPVLTKTVAFFAGVLTTSVITASDITIVEALNYSVPPIDDEVLIASFNTTATFNPAANTGPTTFSSASGGYNLLRNVSLQLSGLTAGAGGFTGTFTIFADAVPAAAATIVLSAAEFVDAGMLMQLTNLKQAALVWTYQWTVVAGALAGAATATLNASFDLADAN